MRNLKNFEENLSSSTNFQKIFCKSSEKLVSKNNPDVKNFSHESIKLPENILEMPKLVSAKVQKSNISEKGSNFATFCNPDTRPYMPVSISQNRVEALLDSGSTRSYVGKEMAEKLGEFQKIQAVMTAANKETTPILGEKDVFLTFKNEKHQLSIRYVNSLSCDFLLGFDFFQEFGLIMNFQRNTFHLRGGEEQKFPPTSGTEPLKIQPVDSLASLSPGPSCIDPRYFLKIKIRGHTVLGLVDTGATRSYLGKSSAPYSGIP